MSCSIYSGSTQRCSRAISYSNASLQTQIPGSSNEDHDLAECDSNDLVQTCLSLETSSHHQHSTMCSSLFETSSSGSHQCRESCTSQRNSSHNCEAISEKFYTIVSVKILARRQKRAILRLQAFTRGSITRLHTSKKLSHHRRRIRQAAKRATDSLKLGNRTTAALSDLMTCKQISQVKKSIESLEVATRLSRECCIRFAHHQHNEKHSAVIVIYNMLTTLNRSGPHMVLRATSLKVLKNVAQWPSLLRAAYVVFEREAREYQSYHSLEIAQNNLPLGKALKYYENLTRTRTQVRT